MKFIISDSPRTPQEHPEILAQFGLREAMEYGVVGAVISDLVGCGPDYAGMQTA